MAVRRQLDAIGQARSNVPHEQLSEVSITRADKPRDDELRVRIQRRPGPHVADVWVFFPLFGDVPFLATDERPNLIALDSSASQVATDAALILGTSAANLDKQLGDGVLRNASHSDRRTDRASLNKSLYDLNATGYRKFGHTDHYA